MTKSEKDEAAIFQIGYNYWLSNGKDFLRDLKDKFNVEVLWYKAGFSGWQEGVVIVIGFVASVIQIAEFLHNRFNKEPRKEEFDKVRVWVEINDEKILLNGLSREEIAKFIVEALDDANYKDWLEDRRKMKNGK